jgi:hypothetical protein
MIEGVITINPVTGSVSTSTGAAGAVFDELNSLQVYGTVTGPSLATAREQLADVARSVAKMITYIQSNAVVSTTTSSTVTVTSVSGVTTGVGVSGPGTGSASGTGTGTVS